METIAFLAFVTLLRVVLTMGQRLLAHVAFDGAEPGTLDGEEREMATKLFGAIDTIPPAARSVLVIVKGARIGGSYVFGALYSLWRALTADLSTLAPGEVGVALIVAPDLRLARQTLRFALGAARSIPAIAKRIENVTSDGFAVRRPDGCLVSIECLPATRGGSAVRGRSLVSVVLSECSFFRGEDAAVNDLEIFKAVAPRVLKGGMIVIESTPWVESGLVFDEFSRNFATPRTAISAHAPTLLMRPDELTRSIVDRERERDPQNAEREFDAQFMTGGSGLFLGPELLAPSIDRNLSPGVGATAIGGDLGLVTDATAFVAVRLDGEKITVIDTLEIRPKKGAPLKLSEVVRRGCEFAMRHGQRKIRVDHHELVAAREHLPKGFELEPCAGGQDAKTDRFLRMREAFRQSNIRIPVTYVKLVNQLSLIISKPKPGGGTQIILPRRAGTHLDLCSAFVLAVDASTSRNEDEFSLALRNLRPIDFERLSASLSMRFR